MATVRGKGYLILDGKRVLKPWHIQIAKDWRCKSELYILGRDEGRPIGVWPFYVGKGRGDRFRIELECFTKRPKRKK